MEKKIEKHLYTFAKEAFENVFYSYEEENEGGSLK